MVEETQPRLELKRQQQQPPFTPKSVREGGWVCCWWWKYHMTSLTQVFYKLEACSGLVLSHLACPHGSSVTSDPVYRTTLYLHLV